MIAFAIVIAIMLPLLADADVSRCCFRRTASLAAYV